MRCRTRPIFTGLFALAVTLTLALGGCVKSTSNTDTAGTTRTKPASLSIKGSDTMVNLNQAWAETYMQNHSDARIIVTGGGSGTGITALIAGQADLAACSRAMKPEELDEANKAKITPVEHTVGWDGIAVVVHPKNPVKSLTLEQLAAMYTGKVTDWKQVGGKPGKIVLLAREVNSGTHVFFKEHVLQYDKSKSDYTKTTLFLPSSQTMVSEVAANVNAVGYVGLGYVTSEVKPMPVAANAKAKAVAPSVESVLNKSYPISRPLYLYTKSEPTGATKAFLDFITGPEGQQIVNELDFVPIQ